MLDVHDLSLSRTGRQILHSVSLRTEQGRVLGLVGPNGAGKSTLLRTLYKALVPESGHVTVDGEDVSHLSRRAIAQRISVVAQQTEATLPLPVRDSVALGRLARRHAFDYGTGDDAQIVDEALAQVGLTGFAERLTDQLSGGELQRVLIARAIAQRASHLLLDEPTNHLDIHHQYLILEMVRTIPATTVIVLHDLNLAAQFCDELVLLENGRVVAAGEPFEVLTPERVSRVYRISADVIESKGRRHLVYESAPSMVRPAPSDPTTPSDPVPSDAAPSDPTDPSPHHPADPERTHS